MDKVQKIREEVARIQLYTQSEVLKQVLDYIDEVQKEPISEKKCMFTKENYTDENRKVLCEGCKEKCEYSKKKEPVSEELGKVGSLKSLEYYPEKKTTNKTSKGVFDANMPRRKAYLRGFKDGAHAHKELIANKPVSEDLGGYINELSKQFPEVSFAKLSRIAVRVAKWQKENLWKPADGDDLPEIDREVIAILDYDFGHYKVVYAHRPNPNGWNGTNIDTGEKEHFEPVIYDKGGWNQPHVLYWLDTRLPYEENKIDK